MRRAFAKRLVVYIALLVATCFAARALYTPSGKTEGQVFIFSVNPEKISPILLQYANRTITVNGQGFTQDSTVYVGKFLVADVVFVSDSRLEVTLPYDYLYSNSYSMRVQTPQKDGSVAVSNTYQGTILSDYEMGFPEIHTVESLPGADSLTLELAGVGFSEDMVFVLGTTEITPVEYIDSEHLRVVITDETLLEKSYYDYYLYSAANPSKHTLSRGDQVVPVVDGTADIESDGSYIPQNCLISHAGGITPDGVGGTNSLEGFLNNYAMGHHLFEFDFQYTADGVLVMMHDQEGGLPTYRELVESFPYTLLTFEDLCGLMVEYPDIKLVTDTKYCYDLPAVNRVFTEIVETVHNVDPSLMDRIIVQYYNPSMYHFLCDNFAFTSYIYTTYMSRLGAEEVLEFVRMYDVPVVTIPLEWGYTDLVTRLNELGTFVFTHTVNDPIAVQELFDNGVYGIYTDMLAEDSLSVSVQEHYSTFVAEQGYRHDILAARALLAETLSGVDLEEGQVLVVSAMGNGGGLLDADMIRLLRGLGLKADISSTGGYVAILDEDGVMTELSGDVSQEGEFAGNGYEATVSLQGYYPGNRCTVQVNGESLIELVHGVQVAIYNLDGDLLEDGLVLQMDTIYPLGG